MRMSEQDKLGADGFCSKDDAPEALRHSFEVAVEKEDGPIGVPDEAPGPKIGGRIAVPAYALDAGQDEPRVPRRPLDILDPIAQMHDEIDLGREAPEGGRQRRDVVV